MSYQGKHARPSRQNRWLTVPLIVIGAIVATASPASAVEPRPNEGLIAMTARACGSSASWKQVAAANGVKGPNYVIFRGKDYKVSCARQPAKASRSTTRTSGWQLPLSNFNLTSCYRTSSRPSHAGIDMAAGYGTPIRAVTGGTVRSAGWRFGGYGISVVVEHGVNVHTHYAHMSRDIVSPGQRVSKGQVIGYVGSTGDSTGNHLHFEVWRGWFNQISPAPYLRAHGVRVGC
jgi:murein DD-endopeptidase MepM/ murein hydrolase activator NlpD